MKKYLFCIVLTLPLILTSCVGIPTYSQSISIADLSKYSAYGFVVSPSDVGYEFTPIAMVEMVFSPGIKRSYTKEVPPEVESIDSKRLNDQYSSLFHSVSVSEPKESDGDFFTPDFDYMLSELVKEAMSLGATGLLNLKIIFVGTKGDPYRPGYYTATAFAVKIK